MLDYQRARRIQVIFLLTQKDSRDALQWRSSLYEGWRNLRTQADYDGLNAAVDRMAR